MSSSQGWQWLDEGKGGKPKWGFVTDEVGAKLMVELDMKEAYESSTARQREKSKGQQAEAGRCARASRTASLWLYQPTVNEIVI